MLSWFREATRLLQEIRGCVKDAPLDARLIRGIQQESYDSIRGIDRKLNTLSDKVDQLMADQGALDAAIATLGNETTTLISAYNALLAKAQTVAPQIDFSTEVSQIQQIGSNITSALSNATGASQAANVPQPGAVGSTTNGAAATNEGNVTQGLVTNPSTPVATPSGSATTSTDASATSVGETSNATSVSEAGEAPAAESEQHS